MKKAFLTLVILFFGLLSNAQITGVGVQLKINFAQQLFTDQSSPFENQKYSSNFLHHPSADFFMEYALTDRIRLRGKVGYERKGFSNRFVILYQHIIQYNKYDYLSLDLGGVYFLNKKSPTQPYLSLGLTTGYVHEKTLNTSLAANKIVNASDSFLSYNDFNVGITTGFGLSFDEVLWVEVEWNRDLIAPTKTETLKVHNNVYAVNVGVNLLKLIKRAY